MNIVFRIIQRPQYLFIMLIVSLSLIAVATLLPNIQLIRQVMMGNVMNTQEKITLLGSLLGSLETNFTTVSRSLLIISSVLTGMQVALVTYFIRQRTKVQQTVGMSFVGTVFNLLGIGCASCGSVIISSFLGISTMALIVGGLPFKGQEFSVIGILVLLFAMKQTVNKINSPEACVIK